ncbi:MULTISPECIES: carboxypeptidase-like regulatory domain-containing protein [unclassified Mucilaginibacter]|uniref:carboxypeptidase-like regulatory domain-containing protein n=1 Tax=unclassified Mucilaginibacter TaxID=2617802 RepID=UPI002AC92280|nr:MULTISPECIES: carboxypeptidase-like regulatory domain-containing protein [unclassified Mucilaginibacter]MEB0280870.1 carboxypeptidase-like regulatory domain-containing protein [Mucilaginibacter sp. 10B2]MEB0302749.1 carboxypeptidase-like regulatory domain-containing protein [Mucilaginibacter sp. 5C4]WPX25647.1 carboxypeptidase-like regulatory domain-containing protein [Mucilaginibacter sp. 5C4]
MLKYFFIAIFISFQVSAQPVSVRKSDTTQLIETLRSVNLTHPTEKVYLSFNNQEYQTGDTIFFKAFVTMGERNLLSDLSQLLYVELLNNRNKVEKQLILKLREGTALGDIYIPDTLRGGNYSIRAYTNFMKNERNYFKAPMLIRSFYSENQIPSTKSIATTYNEMQFFPEGGYMVLGLRSKIAFKATSSDGVGIEVNGSIMDNFGKEVGHFASSHLGMGYFYILPSPGLTYRATAKFADGQSLTFNLPTAQDEGITVSVNNDSLSKAVIILETNQKYFDRNKNKIYTLIIYSKDLLKSVPCTLDTPSISLELAKGNLRTGITQLVLVSPEGKVISERQIFIKNADNLRINAQDSTSSIYRKDLFSFKITNFDTSSPAGSFAVSVMATSKTMATERFTPSPLGYLLLSSDLKGYVQDANYYFRDDNLAIRRNLDLVMLTHGYRKWVWKSLKELLSQPLRFLPEKEFKISGRVTDKKGTPLKNLLVNLLTNSLQIIATDRSNSDGRFTFKDFIDKTSVIIQCNVDDRSKGVNISLDAADKLPSENLGKTLGEPNARGLFENSNTPTLGVQQSSGTFSGKVLKEVAIKGTRRQKLMTKYGIADQILGSDRFNGGGPLINKLMGSLHGVLFPYISDLNIYVAVSKYSIDGPMKVVVNDQEMDRYFNINGIDATKVESVSALTNPTNGNGVLIIKTRPSPNEIVKLGSNGVLPLTVNGIYQARQFYKPRYDALNPSEPQNQVRSVYWDPNATFDKNGKMSINVPLDRSVRYIIKIEGIDSKGRIADVYQVL